MTSKATFTQGFALKHGAPLTGLPAGAGRPYRPTSFHNLSFRQDDRYAVSPAARSTR